MITSSLSLLDIYDCAVELLWIDWIITVVAS